MIDEYRFWALYKKLLVEKDRQRFLAVNDIRRTPRFSAGSGVDGEGGGKILIIGQALEKQSGLIEYL